MDGIELTQPATYWVVALYNEKSEMIFGVKLDGSVEFGPGFTTKDEAAREFWKLLGRHYLIYVNETYIKAGA